MRPDKQPTHCTILRASMGCGMHAAAEVLMHAAGAAGSGPAGEQQRTTQVALAVNALDGVHAALTGRAGEVEHARVPLALLVHLALQQASMRAVNACLLNSLYSPLRASCKSGLPPTHQCFLQPVLNLAAHQPLSVFAAGNMLTVPIPLTSGNHELIAPEGHHREKGKGHASKAQPGGKGDR